MAKINGDKYTTRNETTSASQLKKPRLEQHTYPTISAVDTPDSFLKGNASSTDTECKIYE